MNKDKNILTLAKLDQITIDNKVYQIESQLGGNGASSFKYFNIENFDEKIFIKFLISPRNELELYKFKMEAKFLESERMKPIKIVPRILIASEHETLPIYYYATEWINGKPLEKILLELNNPTLEEIINIVHRCCSSAAYMATMISHRDFHPGNIIFLDEEPEWANQFHTARNFVDAKVIITDFGNAIMPLAFNYEDDGHGNEKIYQNVNRRIEGSFRSLPPEIFSNPIDAFSYNPGCGEAWAIGILFYKLLKGEDILNIESISEYAHLVCTKEIENIISHKLTSIHDKLDNNYILIRILEGLLKVKSSSRMSLGVAAGLFWDYRFGDLNDKPIDFQKKYIDSGRNYPPLRPDEYECY